MKAFIFGTLCALLTLTFAGCASVESSQASVPPALPAEITHIRLLLPAGLASTTTPCISLRRDSLGSVIDHVATWADRPGEEPYTIFAASLNPFAPTDLIFLQRPTPNPEWEALRQKPPFDTPITLQSCVNLSVRQLFERIDDQLPNLQITILTPEGDEEDENDTSCQIVPLE